jgi:hypothetical protein
MALLDYEICERFYFHSFIDSILSFCLLLQGGVDAHRQANDTHDPQTHHHEDSAVQRSP